MIDTLFDEFERIEIKGLHILFVPYKEYFYESFNVYLLHELIFRKREREY